jgi:hypothetical protein
MMFEHVASPWLKEAGLCGALAECRGALHQANSEDHAAVRSVPDARLRITTDSASSALCGAPHNAEFERNLVRERTQAGLNAARARGRKGGRPKVLEPAQRQLVAKLYAEKQHTIGEICRMMGISKPTLYNYIAEANA